MFVRMKGHARFQGEILSSVFGELSVIRVYILLDHSYSINPRPPATFFISSLTKRIQSINVHYQMRAYLDKECQDMVWARDEFHYTVHRHNGEDCRLVISSLIPSHMFDCTPSKHSSHQDTRQLMKFIQYSRFLFHTASTHFVHTFSCWFSDVTRLWKDLSYGMRQILFNWIFKFHRIIRYFIEMQISELLKSMPI